MPKIAIRTFKADEIKDKYLVNNPALDLLIRPQYNKFLIIREEDISHFIKLPIPPIRTTSNFLIFIKAGSVKMNVGTTLYTVGENEILIVPAGQVFAMSSPYIDHVRGFFCSFTPEIALGKMIGSGFLKNFSFLNLWGNHLVKVPAPSVLFFINIFERLLAEYSGSLSPNLLIIQSYLAALLCEIEQAHTFSAGDKGKKNMLITNNFKECLASNFKSIHRISEYASLLHISPNHLNKIVKDTTGKSPKEWIEEMVILESKILLHHTDLNVSEITMEIGISDPSYFSRIFKRQEKVSPSGYRKMIEKS